MPEDRSGSERPCRGFWTPRRRTLGCLGLPVLVVLGASIATWYAGFHDPYPLLQPRILWERPFSRARSCTDIIHEECVIVADGEGRVHCLDLRTGDPVWVTDLGARFAHSTLQVGDAGVLASTWDGNIALLDRGSGDARWTYSIEGATAPPYVWARIADDRVVVRTRTSLVGLDTRNGRQAWAREPEFGLLHVHGDTLIVARGVGSGRTELVGQSVRTGEPLWVYRPTAAFIEVLEVNDPRIWVGVDPGWLTVLDPKDGHEVLPRLPFWSNASVVVHWGVVTTIKPGGGACEACAYSLRDGREVWAGPRAHAHAETTQAVRGSYYVWNRDGAFLRLDAMSGAVLWSRPSPGPRGFMIMSTTERIIESDDAVHVVICDDDRAQHWVYCLDRGTGERRWRMDLRGHPHFLEDGRMLVSGWDGSLSLLERPSR